MTMQTQFEHWTKDNERSVEWNVHYRNEARHDRITPIGDVLRKYGFIRVTGLPMFEQVPEKRWLGIAIGSKRIISRYVGSRLLSKLVRSIGIIDEHVVIVTDIGDVWLGKPQTFGHNYCSQLALEVVCMIDARLGEYRKCDRPDDDFRNLVDVNKLSPAHLLARAAEHKVQNKSEERQLNGN